MSTAADLQQALEQFRADFGAMREQISSVVVGQQHAIEAILTAMVAGGHVLVEGLPGLGKTLLARTLTDAVALNFRRIQFTPDLMPADVIGTYVVMESAGKRKFEFSQGPIFTQVLLADEVNRATPKTQSALVEGMEEFAVTVANETYNLPDPFFVIATQSPGDPEGTFPLPEIQLDRFFFKVRLPFPSLEDVDAILQRTTEPREKVAQRVVEAKRIIEMTQLVREVKIAPEVRRYAVALMLATHPENQLATPLVKRYVHHGASPRGAQAMILAGKVRAILEGRVHAASGDLRAAALPALRHRMVLNYEGQGEGIDPDTVLAEIIKSVKAPG